MIIYDKLYVFYLQNTKKKLMETTRITPNHQQRRTHQSLQQSLQGLQQDLPQLQRTNRRLHRVCRRYYRI